MNRLVVILLLVSMFAFVKTMLDLTFLEEQAVLAAREMMLPDASQGDAQRVSPKRIYEDMQSFVGMPDPRYGAL